MGDTIAVVKSVFDMLRGSSVKNQNANSESLELLRGVCSRILLFVIHVDQSGTDELRRSVEWDMVGVWLNAWHLVAWITHCHNSSILHFSGVVTVSYQSFLEVEADDLIHIEFGIHRPCFPPIKEIGL